MKTLRQTVTVLACGAAIAVAVSGCGGGSTHSSTLTRHEVAGSDATTPSIPTPPGLPSDWQSQAIQAAKARLATCAQANEITPQGCPQTGMADGPDAPVAVRWTLLNEPLADAIAVPDDTTGFEGSTSVGTVDVYGRYQMDVSTTSSGQNIRPSRSYSGGVAHATMSWDGRSFQNVQFLNDFLNPSDGKVPPFTRPAQPTDDAVLAAVKTGFHDCITIAFPPPNPVIPDCPQNARTDRAATSATWSLTPGTDALQGALVSFDTKHGDFVVTGSYDMNLHYMVQLAGDSYYYNNGPHDERSNGQYTATLVWDGQALQLLNIQ